MIKPALTPKEWEEVRQWEDQFVPRARHRVAARALDGQPYGFTEEHRAAVALVASCLREGDYGAKMLWEVHDRIEALLRPRAHEDALQTPISYDMTQGEGIG